MNTFTIAVLASLAAGSASGLGALPVLFFRTLSDRLRDGLLGFSAGIMLAATSFSLIIPGLSAAEASVGAFPGALVVGAGILLGGAFVWMADALTPHEHQVKGAEGLVLLGPGTTNELARKIRRIWLFVFAVTLHNLPEGLAVGVGYGAGELGRGTALALGIGLQNIPEGFAVAIALSALPGMTAARASGLALLSGLVEPIGAIVGAGVVSLSVLLLPWGLAFAAGAMLFVISHEIIPETHAHGHEKHATAGLLLGFVVMMLLDVTLG